MPERARAHLRARALTAEAKRVTELIEKHRDAVLELCFGWRWNRSAGHLRPAPTDDVLAVRGNELREHDVTIVCSS
jgi:hypothetical protein